MSKPDTIHASIHWRWNSLSAHSLHLFCISDIALSHPLRRTLCHLPPMDELHTAQRSERRLSLSNAQQDVLTIDTDLRSPRGSEMSNISPTHSNNPHPANSNATNAPNSNALQSSSATMQPPSAANAKSHHQLSSNVTVSGSTMTNDGKKPLTPRRNGNNSSNSITPMSSISSLHSPNSIAEKIIARKPRSISFYIDLSSNGSLNSTQNSSRVRSLAALQNSKPYRKYKRAPFTSGSAITPNSDEILSRMNARLLRASLKRSSLLQEKRLKLKKRADHIKRKALLQRHKEKLMNLKLKAKTDYAMSAAAIKRQMFLQQRAERSGAKVEHAQNVAMLKRLEKCLHLRKSFSATFAEIVSNSSVLDDLLQDNDDDQQEEPDYTPVSPIKERFNSPLSGRSPRSPLSPIRTGHPIDRELTPLPSPTKLPNSTAINSPLFDTDTNGTTPAITITDDDSYPSPPRSPLRKSQSVPANLFDIEPLKIDIPSTEIEDFLPPITRYTLRELDVQEILSNVQLRHDLIFDPDMQFRPNLEGDRGTQKVIRNQQYWTEVQKEIVEASTGAKPWFRLPLLFMEIREIMSELIPYSKEFEDELDEKFDVELLTQELKHNALNAIGVLEFVAGHLHQYCAPCRDELVDQMVELFKKGEIVESLKKCFEVLEFMKLVSFCFLIYI
ncbi:T-complex protein 11-domain-containing protein [Paraphysoderma sedebokerense]|nr:T-complex protein 11-domain-containing protein [Paraphysoderma sedebokerense]